MTCIKTGHITTMEQQKARPFTAKKWFGHRAGRSPCAHSIGKFFLCYIVLFSSETSAPGSPGNYLYTEKYTEIERYKGESENTIFTTEGEICKCQESNQYGRLKDKIKGRRRRRGESQGVSSIVNIPVYPVRRFRRTRN